MYKPPVRLIKKIGERKTELINFTNNTRDIPIGPIDIKWIVRKYYEQFKPTFLVTSMK